MPWPGSLSPSSHSRSHWPSEPRRAWVPEPVGRALGAAAWREPVAELAGVGLGASYSEAEIKRTLDFYLASSSGAPITYVILAGGASKIPGLSRAVEEAVQLPTQVMNPFNAVSYDPAVFTQDYVNSIGPIAAVPIGLALRAGMGA